MKLEEIKCILRKSFPGWYDKRVRDHHRQVICRVEEVLRSPDRPRQFDDEQIFEELQSRNLLSCKYGYGAYASWKRGIERAAVILEKTGLTTPGARVLEAACGDGMTGYSLACFGHTVTLMDIEDRRDRRTSILPFEKADLCSKLPFELYSFDIICSFNAFEHLSDPRVALQELIKVCVPGGFLFIDSDPLYASPIGLHAWRTFQMPYPQFLFSEEFRRKKIEDLGVYDFGLLQPLNKWRIAQFRELWQESGCEIVSYRENSSEKYLPLVLEYPDAFRDKGLSLDDLTVHGVQILLKKPRNGAK